MYTGLIYNDVFSKSLNIFGSQWYSVYDVFNLLKQKEVMLDPLDSYRGTPYPIGLDPIWQVLEFGVKCFMCLLFNSYIVL